MMSLGNLLQEGKGVSQNKAEAYQWFQKAADKGDEKAKAKLVEWSEVIQAPDKI
jgi:TPR repeat protein